MKRGDLIYINLKSLNEPITGSFEVIDFENALTESGSVTTLDLAKRK